MLEKGLQVFEDYFVLHLTGKALPPDQILENMKKVVQLNKEQQIYKGIIYRSEPAAQVASIFDFYKFSEYLSGQGLEKCKFALVFPKETIEDPIDFFETAAINRGVVFQRFSTFDEAKEWIIKG